MNKVATINLAGRAYQVEEAGYEALKRYLDHAGKKLGDNPDKDEILSDLESAIAQKFDTYLNDHKNVLTSSDMDTILSEMGEVDAESGEAKAGEAGNDASGHKRLYQIREGSMISGVCNGLAAFFDVDVTLVRVLFVLLIFLTGGGFILAYVVMMVLIPVARTPGERAQAHGSSALTAQDVVDRAKEGFDNFKKNSNEWRAWHKNYNHHTRQWKKQMRQEWKYRSRPQVVYHRSSMDELVGTIIGFFWLFVIFYSLLWGYHHVPVIHQTLDSIGVAWENFITRHG